MCVFGGCVHVCVWWMYACVCLVVMCVDVWWWLEYSPPYSADWHYRHLWRNRENKGIRETVEPTLVVNAFGLLFELKRGDMQAIQTESWVVEKEKDQSQDSLTGNGAKMARGSENGSRQLRQWGPHQKSQIVEEHKGSGIMGFYFQESRHLILWHSQSSLVLFGGGTVGNCMRLDVAGGLAISLCTFSFKSWGH